MPLADPPRKKWPPEDLSELPESAEHDGSTADETADGGSFSECGL
jgi:hypothetical protein